MRTLVAVALMLLLLLGATAPLRADEDEGPESTDGESPRELAPGDTAFGQEKGELELAFETEFTNGADEDELALRIGLEYGLTNRIQLEFELPYIFVDPDGKEERTADGFDPADLGLQFGLLSPESSVALSFALGSTIPVVGRNGPGDDEVEVFAGLLAARVLGSTEIFGGVQATWADGPTELEAEIGAVFVSGSIATEIQLTWTDTGEETEWEVRPEIIFEDLGPFDIGVGFPYTILDGEDEWGVALTLTAGID